MANETRESKREKKLEKAYIKIDQLAGAILDEPNANQTGMKVLKKTGLLRMVANLRQTVRAELPEKEPESLPEINFDPLLEEMKPVKVTKKNRKMPQDYKRKLKAKSKKKARIR